MYHKHRTWDKQSIIFVLFLISNCILFVMGLLEVINVNYFDFRLKQYESIFKSVPSNVIVGAKQMVLALLGFYASLKNYSYLLICYSTILLTLSCLNVCAVIILLVEAKTGEEIAEDFENKYSTLYKQYESSAAASEIIDNIHNYYDCCGLHGPDTTVYLRTSIEDYVNIFPSCCPQVEDYGCIIKFAHKPGCLALMVTDEQNRHYELPIFLSILGSIQFCAGQLALYIIH